MTFWIILSGFLSLLFLGISIFCLLRLKKLEKILSEDETRLRELLKLRNSLDGWLKEAREISEKITGEIAEKCDSAAEVSADLDRRVETLSGLLDELKEPDPKTLRGLEPAQQRGRSDQYAEAVRLAQSGLSAEDISKQLGIPLGEVELVRNLRK